jgi:hypothetical protein
MLSHETMPPFLRRARGALLRLVRRRTLSIVVGLLLVLPAAWSQFRGRFDAWWIEGASLVLGATGVALLWNGLTGPKPDWMDDGH